MAESATIHWWLNGTIPFTESHARLLKEVSEERWLTAREFNEAIIAASEVLRENET